MTSTTHTPILTANPSRTCRICLDSDHQEDLISPCLCTGGSAYVHRKCLDNWRAMNKFGRAFNTCEVCQFEYVYEPIVDDPAADKKRLWIFRLFVTRDVSLILILVQAIIVGLAFLLQYADRNSYTIRNYYPASMSSFGVYYLTSLILFFALLGLFGLIGACCGLLSDSETRTGGCACYYCYCAPVDCNGCGGNQNCNGNGNAGGAIGIVIIVLAVIGVFVGVIISVIIFRKIMKRHTNRLWLRQETKKYIVKDFQGKTHELRNLPARQPVPSNISLQNQVYNQQTQTKPSAPSAPVATISKTID
ncbi:unnamed protein product [Adineta ricciae]|uniref:RING-CH-type domain-containing protein n=1 Tax=Adineta ricciae TaxID=249248 RepID=A0A816CVW0_ADIRI|nr:unnamed protein product [Adineta ricciae]